MVRTLCLDCGAHVIVHDEGDGPLMVLISGLGGTADFWLSQRAYFARTHRVISFDQPGCGNAPARNGPVTIDFLAMMTGEILCGVAPGVAPAVLVGHSTGGAIAQACLRGNFCPRPQRLILSGTWARACPYMRSLFGFRIRTLGPDGDGDFAAYRELTWLLGVSPSDVEEPCPDTRPERDVQRARTQIERMRALLDFDGSDALADIDCPTLVLGVEDDRIAPAYHQRDLARTIAGSRLRLLADGGHFYPQSRSGAVSAMISDFTSPA